MWTRDKLVEFKMGNEYFMVTEKERDLWDSVLSAAQILNYKVLFLFDKFDDYVVSINSPLQSFRLELYIEFIDQGKLIEKVVLFKRNKNKIMSENGYFDSVDILKNIIKDL